MRRFLIACLIACLAGPLAAQPTPRPSIKNNIKTTLVPATTDRSNNTRSQTKTRYKRPADTDQSVAPRYSDEGTDNRNNNSGTNARGISTLRPSAASLTPGTTTAKTISGGVKKAATAEEVNPVRVKWMTLDEAIEKSKTEKRKIFVDVFTEMCGWCKRMDSTTFMNPAVVEYLNEHYYPVKFNAEEQEDITFKDKTYHYKKNGSRGYHELAAEWLNNRLSYPTVVFLDENQGVIQPLPGYQDAAKMEAILNYFGTDSHKKTPWEAYQRNFSQQQR